MTWIEPLCAVIVVAWLVGASRRLSPGWLVRAWAVLFFTAWASEETCIRLYGFYGYSPSWSLFLGHVPLLVAAIWPVVVISAWGLARAFGVRKWLPLVGAVLVFADASLIEPVSVHAGLWSWTHPGLFGVPPIGVLGWFFFAGLAMVLLERLDRGPRSWLPWVGLVPPGTHLLLVGAWWGLFRWMEGSIPVGPALGVAGLLGLGACVGVARLRPIPRHLLLERVPAALFFLVLMVVYRAHLDLAAWAMASTPAWLLLTGRSKG